MLAPNSTCAAGKGTAKDAPAFQIANDDHSCYSLGSSSTPQFGALDVGNLSAGLLVSYGGGDDGRKVIFKLACGPASGAGGPDASVGVVESTSFTYTVSWTHPAACPVFEEGKECPPAPSPPAPPPAKLPVPTLPQLRYAQSEIRALIHFNMATYVGDGDPGCNKGNWNSGRNASNPATFNPEKLNASQWMDSMDAMGIRNFVLTAKHGCGHLLWPTEVTLPGGIPYTYCVGKEQSAVKLDVLQHVVDAANARGIGAGFYYSMTNNFYMKVSGLKAHPELETLPGQVANLTQADYERIAVAQLMELWTRYGNLTELWFDGTYPTDLHETIKELIMDKQPGAAVWNGLGMYDPTTDNRISNSGVRWIGTEGGHVSEPIWSTAAQRADFSGTGDPNSPVWAPAGVDSTLQDPKRWFWTEPATAIASVAELQTRYHQSVGNNGVIEMDFAINPDGLVDPVHAQRYKDFGDWIHACYGGPPAFSSRALASSAGVVVEGDLVEVSLASASTVDRVMVQEDQAQGQRIRSYAVHALVGGAWQQLSKGTAVGNKRIDLFASVAAQRFRLEIIEAAAWPVSVINFGVFAPCADTATTLV